METAGVTTKVNYRNSPKDSDGKYVPKKSDTRADPLQN